jgi:cytochrome c-type biogenesis protein CcmH
VTLWIVLTVMISAAGAALSVALVRRQDERRDRPGEAAALRAELADLDAQAAAGILPARTAEGLKTETIRRFLGREPDEGRARRPLGRAGQMALAVGLSAFVALGATVIYARLGRPSLAAARTAGAQAPSPDDSRAAQIADLIPQLEAKVRAHPDPTGLRLLGGAYMGVGRYADAAADFARLAGLDPHDGDARSARGEALVRASGGVVDAAAAQAFSAALAVDPADARARYFLGLRKDQQGDHPGAMADWIALIKNAPPGAPWLPEVRQAVEQSAADHHEDISDRLAPPQQPASSGAGDDAAARQAMVEGMVRRLDLRLRSQPKDAPGWIQLMRARMVLGQGDAAADAYHRAIAAFNGSPAEQKQFTQAAKRLGVPGA